MAPRFIASRVHEGEAPDEGSGGFQVAWSINPHMVPGSTCVRTAAEQHDALVSALRSAGAEVDHVPFVPECFDSVFVKDNALLLGRDHGSPDALLSRPRHRERAREQPARRRELEARGFAVTECPLTLEGGDLARLEGSFVLGHGFRSERAAAALVSATSDAPVLGLELVDPHLYHLDTALTVLDDGVVLACPSAFSRESWRALCRWRDVSRVVEIPRADAVRFGLNCVRVDRRVVLSDGAPSVERALERLGYDPIVVSLDQFHRAGGSAACLVNEVHAPLRALRLAA
jgi:N-dimethylarginine dimethylaminohydrolase